MGTYGEFIRALLRRADLLTELCPKEPLLWSLSDRFRSMPDAELAGENEIRDPASFALVRGAAFYGLDEIDAAHRIFQDDATAFGSYWHGMAHRREGDFDNARYWFRRAGRLPVFAHLQAAARGMSPAMDRQDTWDAYLFTGLCEQARFGEQELVPECQRLQRVEFEVLLGRAWEKAVGGPVDPSGG